MSSSIEDCFNKGKQRGNMLFKTVSTAKSISGISCTLLVFASLLNFISMPGCGSVKKDMLDMDVHDLNSPDSKTLIDGVGSDFNENDSSQPDLLSVDLPLLDVMKNDAKQIDLANIDLTVVDSKNEDSIKPDALAKDAKIPDSIAIDSMQKDLLTPDILLADVSIPDAILVDLSKPDVLKNVDSALIDVGNDIVNPPTCFTETFNNGVPGKLTIETSTGMGKLNYITTNCYSGSGCAEMTTQYGLSYNIPQPTNKLNIGVEVMVKPDSSWPQAMASYWLILVCDNSTSFAAGIWSEGKSYLFGNGGQTTVSHYSPVNVWTKFRFQMETNGLISYYENDSLKGTVKASPPCGSKGIVKVHISVAASPGYSFKAQFDEVKIGDASCF